ncbi:hypothetical protein OH764_26675 [Burkholderia sp. M6-3]
MADVARIELARSAQLDLHLTTLPTDDDQRQHPLIITHVGREEIVDDPGARKRLGLSGCGAKI